MYKLKLLLLAAAVSLVFIFSGCAANKPASGSAGSSATSAQPSASSTASSQKFFTVDELKKYNGKNGAPAYVAVNGIVYDVTNAKDWKNGTHQGFSAGQDLTQAIAKSPHGTSVLSGLPVVGKLQ